MKIKFNSFVIGCVIGPLIAAYALPKIKQKIELAKYTEIESNTLQLNMIDSVYYKTFCSEEKAISQMRNISQFEINEESWMIVNDSVIYETGIDNFRIKWKNQYMTGIKKNKTLENKIFNDINTKIIIDYHYHPPYEQFMIAARSKSEKNKFTEDKERFEKSNSIKGNGNVKILNNFFKGDEKPSLPDLKAMISKSKYIHQNYPHIKYINKICSENGITSYQLTKPGLKEFSKDKTKTAKNLFEGDYSIVKNDQQTKLESKYVRIIFTPF